MIVQVVRGRGEDSTFLFLERSGGRFAGQWWPVAGTCEPGESPIETVVREVEEETGLPPRSVYTVDFSLPHPEQDGHLQNFVAFVPDAGEIELNHEHSDFRWMSIEEAVAFVPDGMEHLIRGIARRFLLAAPPVERRVWP